MQFKKEIKVKKIKISTQDKVRLSDEKDIYAYDCAIAHSRPKPRDGIIIRILSG